MSNGDTTGTTTHASGTTVRAKGGAAVPPSQQQGSTAPAGVNEVRLVGRLSAAGELHELPSGDPVVNFRLVVSRPEPPPDHRSAPPTTPPSTLPTTPPSTLPTTPPDTPATSPTISPATSPTIGPDPTAARARRRPTVDTVDCTAWTAAARACVLGYEAGAVLEVHGALRRRFYRSAAGTLSRYDVETARVRRAVGG